MINTPLIHTMKLNTTLMMAVALMACQGEISAQVSESKENISAQTEKVKESISAQTAEVTEDASAQAEEVEEVTEDVSAQAEAVKDEVSADTSPPEEHDSAQHAELDEKTYTVVDPPLEPSTGEKIEVTELFWYGCGHCFTLEPHIKSWKAKIPSNASFVKVPAVFSEGWKFHGQAFYTMEALGVFEKANDAFFHNIHVKRNPINDLDQLVDFLADFDKSEEEVTKAFNSFAVDNKVRNAKMITEKSKAKGVPAILVDGKYLTSVSLAGSADKMFAVVNKLVEKSAAER